VQDSHIPVSADGTSVADETSPAVIDSLVSQNAVSTAANGYRFLFLFIVCSNKISP